MAKALPKKWFAGFKASISLRKVDKWAEHRKSFRPYFDTWEEAHLHMLCAAEKRLDKAKREAKSAERHLEKVRSLKTPNAELSGGEAVRSDDLWESIDSVKR
jgi:hypothetical protein